MSMIIILLVCVHGTQNLTILQAKRVGASSSISKGVLLGDPSLFNDLKTFCKDLLEFQKKLEVLGLENSRLVEENEERREQYL